MSLRYLLTGLLVLTLLACSSSPAPVPDSVDTPPAVLPMPPVQETPANTREPNPAAAALIAQAKTHQSRADFATASSLLERAVRIAPTEPEPYVALARLRLDQNRSREAEQLALKAANLGGLDSETRERLWYLVAECRELQGNHDGAQQARVRAMAD